MTNDGSRRDFFRGLFGTAVTAAMAQSVLAQRSSGDGIPTARLGRTNEQVSIICLGGWHIGAVEDKKEAHRIMHRAIDEGVNFFDNAWDYHDGGSEEVMGDALASGGRRKKVFVMTKNCERDYEGSKRNLEDSLRRLRTDYIDLWQFHEINYDNDPDWVFDKGGLEAALEAKKEGKVRYVGFTGHKDPRIHLKMLAQPYDWDTSQMPINIMDAHFRSFQKDVVPVCLNKNVGVIGMKSLGGSPTSPQGRIPSQTKISAEQCIRYALSLPIASLCVGIRSMKDLEQDVGIARGFQALSDSDKEQLIQMAAGEGGDGRHEMFKSTNHFDGPHHRLQHGFALDV
ncbi:MAG: aldo/keto reductase [Bryobacterales bacterium]|nr:aldo/keto reductase [Bryobacterales bacterium]MDE0292904.1 aldo/keto reductase [Bryobacterales bacterium]MDE0434460.1 aldo/keto reductase [Bryobacterales bacterium]